MTWAWCPVVFHWFSAPASARALGRVDEGGNCLGLGSLQPLQMTYNIIHGFEHCILLLPSAHLIHQDLFDLGDMLLGHEVRLHLEVHCNHFLHGGWVALLDCEGDLLVVHLAHVLLKQLVASTA